MHSCSNFVLREPLMKFWFSCKRTQNIIFTKQCNRGSMKYMLAMINHCHLETAFIKFPSCHFKEQFKRGSVSTLFATPEGKFKICLKKNIFDDLRGSWNPLGPVVQNPD